MPRDYMTVVIQLPEDPVQRKAIGKALPMSGSFLGGRITAMSLEDEITVNEVLERDLDPDTVELARAEAKRIARSAEQAGDPAT